MYLIAQLRSKLELSDFNRLDPKIHFTNKHSPIECHIDNEKAVSEMKIYINHCVILLKLQCADYFIEVARQSSHVYKQSEDININGVVYKFNKIDHFLFEYVNNKLAVIVQLSSMKYPECWLNFSDFLNSHPRKSFSIRSVSGPALLLIVLKRDEGKIVLTVHTKRSQDVALGKDVYSCSVLPTCDWDTIASRVDDHWAKVGNRLKQSEAWQNTLVNIRTKWYTFKKRDIILDRDKKTKGSPIICVFSSSISFKHSSWSYPTRSYS